MRLAALVMWGSLGLIAWTHLGYPLAAAAGARVRRYRPCARDGYVPSVALVIPAHNEEGVIVERLENALALDYPMDQLEVILSLDGPTDRTAAAAAPFEARGVRILANTRRGKVAAQNAAVASTHADVIAFSDANSLWEADALRRLVRNLADPDVGYVCGRLDLVERDGGDNRETLYWRYELWLREQESRLDSITAGNGAIYAVRRAACPELAPEFSHDLGLPYRLRRAGLRSVYEPSAVAVEPALPSVEAEWGRKERMLSQAWCEMLRGGMLDPRGQPLVYYVELVSHRALRYASGMLHLALLASSAYLARENGRGRAFLAAQSAWLALAAAGRRSPGSAPLAGLAWYYLAVTAASVSALVRVLARGPITTWSRVEGAR